MSYKCNLDENGWQLYEMNGAKKAAQNISLALTQKINAAKSLLEESPMLSEQKLAEGIRDEMYKLMGGYSKYGARDTEPECVLVSTLEQAFRLDAYSLER